jgi:hypothetical protein
MHMKTQVTCLSTGVSFDAAALFEPLSGAWKGLIQKSQLKVGEDVGDHPERRRCHR